MMAMLPPIDRSKLIGILGMLASDFDGERAAAGLLATRLLRQHGLGWGDVIGNGITRQAAEPSDPSMPWRTDLALARRYILQCGTWEKGFVRSIERRHWLTAKQGIALCKIARSLRARGFV